MIGQQEQTNRLQISRLFNHHHHIYICELLDSFQCKVISQTLLSIEAPSDSCRLMRLNNF